MEAPLKKAILLNNAGAKYLERSNYTAATKSLTMAFRYFKKTYDKSKSSFPKESSCHGSSGFNIDEWMRKVPCTDGEDIEIYGHAIIVPETLETDASSCGLISTAITFNLALANHHNALQTNDTEMFRTAARLYEYGFGLERIRGKFFVSPFFLVTVLNNLGQIYRSVDDVDRSEKCFRQLLSTLLYLTQIKGANPKYLEIFFGNTSCYLSRCAGAA